MYLEFSGVEFLYSIGHVQSDISIGIVTLYKAIRKYALFFTISVQVLHCLVGEVYLLGPIRVVFLVLAADGEECGISTFTSIN